MPRRATVLASAVLAGALLAAVPAPASAAGEIITGTSNDKRFGKVTLTFTTDPSMVRLTLSEKLARTTAKKDFDVECRTNGRYKLVAGFRLLGDGSRRLTAPAQVPLKADRCVVRRRAWTTQATADQQDAPVVARMTMRRRDS
ncbi:MAG TPA: hypothetical protein VN238_03250 [Solirubrobacteraceae bacterium]|nr:hypothetical protein [Solirubrobacteraceae bacterium]